MQYKLRIRPVFPKAPSVHVAVAARRSPFWREAGLTAAGLPLNAEGEIHPALNLSQSAHHMRESGCFLGSPFSATPVFFLLKILNGVGQWGRQPLRRPPVTPQIVPGSHWATASRFFSPPKPLCGDGNIFDWAGWSSGRLTRRFSQVKLWRSWHGLLRRVRCTKQRSYGPALKQSSSARQFVPCKDWAGDRSTFWRKYSFVAVLHGQRPTTDQPDIFLNALSNLSDCGVRGSLNKMNAIIFSRMEALQMGQSGSDSVFRVGLTGDSDCNCQSR